LTSTVICSEAIVDWLPAASVATKVSVCVPLESSVVGRVSVCGPVDDGQGWANVKLHGAL
jgi:hypothetical protein